MIPPNSCQSHDIDRELKSVFIQVKCFLEHEGSWKIKWLKAGLVSRCGLWIPKAHCSDHYLVRLTDIDNCSPKQYLKPIFFNFGHCKLHFSSITLHMRVALKSQYLFVVDAKPFQANQNVKYEYYHCVLRYLCFKIIFADTLHMALANAVRTTGALLLRWINFSPRMHEQIHPLKSVGWNYWSLPKLEQCNRWSLGMDK